MKLKVFQHGDLYELNVKAFKVPNLDQQGCLRVYFRASKAATVVINTHRKFL